MSVVTVIQSPIVPPSNVTPQYMVETQPYVYRAFPVLPSGGGQASKESLYVAPLPPFGVPYRPSLNHTIARNSMYTQLML